MWVWLRQSNQPAVFMFGKARRTRLRQSYTQATPGGKRVRIETALHSWGEEIWIIIRAEWAIFAARGDLNLGPGDRHPSSKREPGSLILIVKCRQNCQLQLKALILIIGFEKICFKIIFWKNGQLQLHHPAMCAIAALLSVDRMSRVHQTILSQGVVTHAESPVGSTFSTKQHPDTDKWVWDYITHPPTPLEKIFFFFFFHLSNLFLVG